MGEPIKVLVIEDFSTFIEVIVDELFEVTGECPCPFEVSELCAFILDNIRYIITREKLAEWFDERGIQGVKGRFSAAFLCLIARSINDGRAMIELRTTATADLAIQVLAAADHYAAIDAQRMFELLLTLSYCPLSFRSDLYQTFDGMSFRIKNTKNGRLRRWQVDIPCRLFEGVEVHEEDPTGGTSD